MDIVERELIPTQVDELTIKANKFDELTARVEQLIAVQGNIRQVNFVGADSNVVASHSATIIKAAEADLVKLITAAKKKLTAI